MKFLTFLSMLLDRVFVVLGAFLGSQIPLFMQQYTQRLAGHVAEINHLMDRILRAAQLSNKTLEQYISKFLESGDVDFHRQGEFMEELVIRWQNLNIALTDLTTSSIWSRPYFFLKNLQQGIAHSTWESFQPGISFTLEGMVYTGIGILIGFSFYQLILKCFLFLFRRNRPFAF